jgi:hypothetical protein
MTIKLRRINSLIGAVAIYKKLRRILMRFSVLNSSSSSIKYKLFMDDERIPCERHIVNSGKDAANSGSPLACLFARLPHRASPTAGKPPATWSEIKARNHDEGLERAFAAIAQQPRI